VGTGKNHSVLELAGLISNNTVKIESRKGEAYITQADNSKIQRVLGWTPKKHIEDYIKEQLQKD
jgi:nucleoside-diphosphate-sugar epimerase